MVLLYRLAISAYVLAIHIAAVFSPKARQWVDGRKGWKKALSQKVASLPTTRIWIHCASLGEFEQGRPVIEALRREYPNVALVLTFFSPSGYTIRKDYDQVDYVCYLPADTPSNARFFVQTLQPTLALFVKYELWYDFLKALKAAEVPAFLVSAVFHPNHVFFQWHGGFFRKMLGLFDHIFVQNDASKQRLASIGLSNTTITGDTRIDRVYQLAQSVAPIPIIEAFKGKDQLFIAGSTWPPGEQMLSQLLRDHWPAGWKMIIAPHDINTNHISQLKKSLPLPYQTISGAREHGLDPTAKVLIIDNIGMLNRIYQYGAIAYIGGGFGKAIHNTLEPMAYGLPVLIGPNKHHRFEEAVQMRKAGGLFILQHSADLIQHFKALQAPSFYEGCSTTVRTYIASSAGATARTLQYLGPLLSGHFAADSSSSADSTIS
jgi:3-deoxy-D-manno-octulosonic-acid transferase